MSRSESFPGVEPDQAETRSDVRARLAVRRQAQTVSGQQDGRRVRGHRRETEQSGGTEDSNPGQTQAVDSSGSRQRPDGIARESLGRQPWALRRGRVCHPVFRSPRIIPFPAVSPKRSAAETWAGTRTKMRRLLPVGPLGGASSQRLGPESRSASVDSPGRARPPFPSSVSLRA